MIIRTDVVPPVPPAPIICCPGDVVCLLWKENIAFDLFRITKVDSPNITVSNEPVKLIGPTTR